MGEMEYWGELDCLYLQLISHLVKLPKNAKQGMKYRDEG